MGEQGAKSETAAAAELQKLQKDLTVAQQEMKKSSVDREQQMAQISKLQQELKSSVVERERLQSQLEMLVNELSNQQVSFKCSTTSTILFDLL